MPQRQPSHHTLRIPIHATPVRAGFPSPAEDYLEPGIDLARAVSGGRRSVTLVDVPDPAGRVPRVVLAVDGALKAVPGDAVLAEADGYTVVVRLMEGAWGRWMSLVGGRALVASEVRVRGVVTWSMRGYRPGPARGEGFGFLVPSPPSTFMFAVDGSSMRGAGIREGDVLVVDRALEPGHGDVVVASVGGGRTVKRFVDAGGGARLAFEEEENDLRFLPLNPEDSVFGVVTWCLHRLRAPAAPARPGRRGR